jgi:hypothetical protein
VPPDGAEYSVTITRSDFPPGAEMCVMAADTASAFAVVITDCSGITDLLLSCVEDVPETDTSLIITDGCGSPLIFSQDLSNNGFGCIDDTLFITRYYIIDFDGDTILTTDDRDTCTQVFTIVDAIPPMITCPQDITLECTDPTSTDVTGVATATDNCAGMAGITFEDSTASGACIGEQILFRTWSAMDQCGNIATCIQTIFLEDNTAPEIACPPNTTISCEESTDPANTGTATANDACDPMPVIGFTDTQVPGA